MFRAQCPICSCAMVAVALLCWSLLKNFGPILLLRSCLSRVVSLVRSVHPACHCRLAIFLVPCIRVLLSEVYLEGQLSLGSSAALFASTSARSLPSRPRWPSIQISSKWWVTAVLSSLPSMSLIIVCVACFLGVHRDSLLLEFLHTPSIVQETVKL